MSNKEALIAGINNYTTAPALRHATHDANELASALEMPEYGFDTNLLLGGDTLVVTHIDRLSRGLTYGLQVIEGLHRAGVEFRSLSEDFDTATPTGRLQLSMVLAFSEWWRNSIRERSVAGQAKARAEGRFPGRRPSLSEQQREYIRAERSKGMSQRELGTGQATGGQPLDHPTGGQVGVGWKLQPLHEAWPVGSLPQLRSQDPVSERPKAPATAPEASRSQSGQVLHPLGRTANSPDVAASAIRMGLHFVLFCISPNPPKNKCRGGLKG